MTSESVNSPWCKDDPLWRDERTNLGCDSYGSLAIAPLPPEQVAQLEAGRPRAEQRECEQRRVRVLVEEHLQPRVAAPTASTPHSGMR